MIDIEKREFGPDLLNLADEWEDLLSRCSRPTIYSTFDYVYTSCSHFKRDEEIVFLLLRDAAGGRLLAIFPVSIWKDTECGIPIRRLEPGITVTSSEVDKPYPIIDRDFENECWKRYSEYIRRELGPWDLFVYDELWLESGLNRALRRLFPLPAYWAKTREGAESPIFDLDCEWDAYWNAHRHIRNKIRRMEKQLGDRFSFRVTCDPQDVDRCLDAYIATEQAGTKPEAGIMRAEKQQFYRELLPKLAAKEQLYFATLYDGDTVVGVHVAFVFRKRVYFALSSFNPAYGNLSPGMVLHFLFIQYFCGKGYHLGDFLAGYAHYLYTWADRVEKTVNIRVRKSGWKNGYIILRHQIWKIRTKCRRPA